MEPTSILNYIVGPNSSAETAMSPLIQALISQRLNESSGPSTASQLYLEQQNQALRDGRMALNDARKSKVAQALEQQKMQEERNRSLIGQFGHLDPEAVNTYMQTFNSAAIGQAPQFSDMLRKHLGAVDQRVGIGERSKIENDRIKAQAAMAGAQRSGPSEETITLPNGLRGTRSSFKAMGITDDVLRDMALSEGKPNPLTFLREANNLKQSPPSTSPNKPTTATKPKTEASTSNNSDSITVTMPNGEQVQVPRKVAPVTPVAGGTGAIAVPRSPRGGTATPQDDKKD